MKRLDQVAILLDKNAMLESNGQPQRPQLPTFKWHGSQLIKIWAAALGQHGLNMS